MREQSDRKEEFTEQLRQSHRQLLGYIFTLLRNLEDAQDVFQQTCIVLWDHFDEFEPGTNFTAWACTVAQFKVRDFLKCRRRYEAHLSEVFVERLAARGCWARVIGVESADRMTDPQIAATVRRRFAGNLPRGS